MSDYLKRLSEPAIARLKGVIFLLALWPLAKLIVLGYQDDLAGQSHEEIDPKGLTSAGSA